MLDLSKFDLIPRSSSDRRTGSNRDRRMTPSTHGQTKEDESCTA